MTRAATITIVVLGAVAIFEAIAWFRIDAAENSVDNYAGRRLERDALHRGSSGTSIDPLVRREPAVSQTSLNIAAGDDAAQPVSLGNIATPTTIGHIPGELQLAALTRIQSALARNKHSVLLRGNGECFLGQPTPERAEIDVSYDAPELKITLKGSSQKSETLSGVTEDMIRSATSFDDLLPRGASLSGDVGEFVQNQASASAFASSNGYPVLTGWAPCPPTSEEALEIVEANPSVELTNQGYIQVPGRGFSDGKGGLISWDQVGNGFLIHYHRRQS